MVYALLGGTGTLGHSVTRQLLKKTHIRIRILARGEHKLSQMQREFSAHSNRLSFLVGDVRDQRRLEQALVDVDRVIHMAALKHVNSCEYNILEATSTNVEGSANVVRACGTCGVKQVVLVSTDKAVEPTTAYGATKMVAERVFIHGNSYTPRGTRFHVVRYGNVIGSQGSVVELWQQQMSEGAITLTDPDITRFWWSADEAARFVLKSFDFARRGDIIIPLMAACTLADLAKIVAPNVRQLRVDRYGIEKDHEVLLAAHEAPKTTYISEIQGLRISTISPIPMEPAWGTARLTSADACSAVSLKRISKCLSGQ